MIIKKIVPIFSYFLLLSKVDECQIRILILIIHIRFNETFSIITKVSSLPIKALSFPTLELDHLVSVPKPIQLSVLIKNVYFPF